MSDFSGLIFSRLGSLGEFQMFILVSGHHIGVPRRYTNMAFGVSANFDEYLKFGATHGPKTWRSVLFYLL